MSTYQEFLRTCTVPRATIDRFLDDDDPTWARFDEDVGYTLGRYLPRDGLDDSWTISTAQDNGQRTARNFGMGGFGTYQAYRRMRRIEVSALGGSYVILYIWGDDHCRSIMRCRHAATHRVWDDQNGYLFHGNFWANIEMDLDAGAFVERDSMLTTPASLYQMCDADFMVEALTDDLMVMLYGMERFGVDGDSGKLNRLAEHLGVDGIHDTDPDQRMASVRALKMAYGFAASRYIVAAAASFAEAHDKQLLACLLCPTATEQVLCKQPRYDQGFVTHLRDHGYRVFDMNEVHGSDYAAFNLSVEAYRRRYWIGHYAPAGNHFFAYSLKDTIVDWLEPKPRTYRGEALSSADFAGYLPDAASLT